MRETGQAAVGFENGNGAGAKERGQPREVEKARSEILPPSLQKNNTASQAP